MKRLVQRLAGRTVSETSYWISEYLCSSIAHRTTCEKLNAAAAIAAVQTLDVTRLVEIPEARLPDLIRHNLPAFTAAEWQEVLALVRDNRECIEDGLQRCPEWEHLRRTAIA